MTSLKPLKISNPIYYGYLSLFVFLFMVSCDNEPAEGQHIPQLKKVSLNAREISEDIKNFIESGKATVVLTITTDKEGKVPAADYTALTTEDKTAKSLKKVTFPIEKDGSIDAFFLKASESGNTYYIQKFDFYKSGVSSSKPDYVLAEVKPFTLKIEGDNQVTLPITLNEVKTKGSTRLSSLKVAFKTMQYAYFTKDNDIDLTIRYIKSDKKYTVIDQQNVFNCKKVTIEEGKWLTIRLNDDEDFYKDGTFEVEAKVNDYPSALAVHDFIIPTEVDKQIRSGKLVLKMNNHLPSTTAAKNILTIDNFLTVTGVYDVKEEGGITTQDSDKDKLLIQYRYVILYRYKNPRAPDSTEPFDAVIPGTLSERCSTVYKAELKEMNILI